MKRLVTPFSAGLVLGLMVIATGLFATVFYVHRAGALSNVGPDGTDFAVGGSTGAYYTLSDTTDVKGARSMGINLYHSGPKPTSSVTVTVAYQGGSQTCLNQNSQGYARVGFTSYVSSTGYYGTATLSIPPSAWVDNGVGASVDLTANIIDGTNFCGGGNDGNHVNFQLVAPSGYVVGPAASTYFTITQGSYCVSGGVSCNAYVNYNIPFAPACSVMADGFASAKITDMDNDGLHPVIQPQPASVKVIDTTTGFTVNNNTYSGSEANGGLATFSFGYQAHHRYTLQLNHVNLNNVLQIQIPFDSVDAQINCAPSGGIVSDAAGACTSVQGWMYDVDNSSTKLQYYVYVNPLFTPPPTTYSSAPSASNFVGPFTADLANPGGTPAGTPSNHGFKIDIPADVTGHGYRGPWNTDNYYIYAKDASASNLKQIDSISVPAGTCATVSCGTTNFALDTVGSPDSFTVNMKLNGASTAPPGSPTFTITVTGSGGPGTNSQSFNGVAASGATGGYVYSDPVTFTPTGAGTYNVTWSYYGVSGCGDSSNASYSPYFGVTAGDIAAGAGFGNGSCAESTANIASWNKNTDASPNYFGAGTELGALATGHIKNFVSGMGLSGGAGAQSGHGLSFANAGNSESNTPPNYGGSFGGNSIPCIDDYYGTKAAANPASVSSDLTNSDFSSMSGSYTASPGGADNAVMIGDAANDPITIPVGRTITLYVQGNVFIRSNILYQTPYSLTTVPRFNLYVQGDIYIDPSVTELHGVYIAQKSSSLPGNITTCAENTVVTFEPYNICTKQLLVVGAMAAEGQLRLTRTHGSLVGVGAAGVPAEPAEVFQYSPEMWLNAPTTLNPKLRAYTSLPPVL